MASCLKVVVLVSGNGSNLQALIDACAHPHFPARIVHVIANKQKAYALTRAVQAGIPTTVVENHSYPSREAFDRAVSDVITQAGAELVCLAGFMRLLTPWFVEQWHNRLINIHPSLLPAFKGVEAQRQALEAGVAITGCTTHLVRTAMDSGPILLQEEVKVAADDTVDSLTTRILASEHRMYPTTLWLLAKGYVTLQGDHVLWDEKALPIRQAEVSLQSLLA